MPDKIHITFVIPELTGGGAERILLDIMKNLDRKRFSGSLVLFESGGKFDSEVPADMPVQVLGESRHYRVAGLFRIIRKLYRIIRAERPSVVFSIINVANFLAIPAARLARTTVMAYEVSHPYLDLKEEFSHPGISMRLLKLTYPMADMLIALSEGIKESLHEDFGIRPDKISVSYTPFDIELIRNRAQEKADHPWFGEDIPIVTGIGTLIERKGFHILIKALADVREKTPARLMLIGEGPMRRELEELADELKVRDSVHFIGFDHNPWKYLRHSTLFVLSSLHEGLGNVIIEAMICGVPVISADCPVGPREILQDGKAGILVPPGDHHEMAAAITRVLTDGELRAALARKAGERALDFDRSTVMMNLERLIESTVRPGKH